MPLRTSTDSFQVDVGQSLLTGSSPTFTAVTLSGTGAAGAIVRQNAAGGALTASGIVTAQATPADPTLTASTTGVMMGFAVSITPVNSGKLLILVSGDCTDSVISDGCALALSKLGGL